MSSYTTDMLSLGEKLRKAELARDELIIILDDLVKASETWMHDSLQRINGPGVTMNDRTPIPLQKAKSILAHRLDKAKEFLSKNFV